VTTSRPRSAHHRQSALAALAALEPADHDVLLLLAWGQLSYEEIATVLEVPVGTVRSRLNRARGQIRCGR
jgi:RNA polymerase sigma factor (sigma-70 family)